MRIKCATTMSQCVGGVTGALTAPNVSHCGCWAGVCHGVHLNNVQTVLAQSRRRQLGRISTCPGEQATGRRVMHSRTSDAWRCRSAPTPPRSETSQLRGHDSPSCTPRGWCLWWPACHTRWCRRCAIIVPRGGPLDWMWQRGLIKVHTEPSVLGLLVRNDDGGRSWPGGGSSDCEVVQAAEDGFQAVLCVGGRCSAHQLWRRVSARRELIAKGGTPGRPLLCFQICARDLLQ